MVTVNPIKKVVVKTSCIVHKYINMQAIHILNNDGYEDAAQFFKENIKPLNEGAVWADQDFKSINHFFHYSEERGLYGFSNALDEGVRYNREAIRNIKRENLNKALFFVGAVAHLIQDATVPHHVNNRLLKSHKGFESWIRLKLFNHYDFSENSGTLRQTKLKDFMKNNAEVANNAYYRFNQIEDREERYFEISRVILKQAQISTAGYLLNFYEEHVGKQFCD
ncbi:phospholipase C [Clostridium polyendosporum]|uniref:Phospholipase C n=2 Tax=Clostridium polyendosporum TaxID=69208 RepID=A0A919S1N2_9CLOT|nr:phospholipase C [Clostridium polyendosporum]